MYYVILLLEKYNDPRIADFYDKTAADGSYRAIPYGDRTSTVYSIRTTSRATIGALDPVYYMSAAEAEYLLAECYARLADKTSAKTHYDNAVRLSFERWGYDADDFIKAGGVYEFDDANEDNMLKCILTQNGLLALVARLGTHGSILTALESRQ